MGMGEKSIVTIYMTINVTIYVCIWYWSWRGGSIPYTDIYFDILPTRIPVNMVCF